MSDRTDRIAEIIEEAGRPVTAREIYEADPGICVDAQRIKSNIRTLLRAGIIEKRDMGRIHPNGLPVIAYVYVGGK